MRRPSLRQLIQAGILLGCAALGNAEVVLGPGDSAPMPATIATGPGGGVVGMESSPVVRDDLGNLMVQIDSAVTVGNRYGSDAMTFWYRVFNPNDAPDGLPLGSLSIPLPAPSPIAVDQGIMGPRLATDVSHTGSTVVFTWATPIGGVSVSSWLTVDTPFTRFRSGQAEIGGGGTSLRVPVLVASTDFLLHPGGMAVGADFPATLTGGPREPLHSYTSAPIPDDRGKFTAQVESAVTRGNDFGEDGLTFWYKVSNIEQTPPGMALTGLSVPMPPDSPTAVFINQTLDAGQPAQVAINSGGSVTFSFIWNPIPVGSSSTWLRMQTPFRYFELAWVGVMNGSGEDVPALRPSLTAPEVPPVAVAGNDQIAATGINCLATVTVDGSGSWDPMGDSLGYRWDLFSQGNLLDTVFGSAIATWHLPAGIYEAVLTVETLGEGSPRVGADSLAVEVSLSAPTLTALSPSSAFANGPGFSLTVTGGCFQPGDVLYWNGEPRPTTVISGAELAATISETDLAIGVPLSVATIQVVTPGSKTSNALGFSVVTETVKAVEAAVAAPGETSVVTTAPSTEGEAGVTAVVENSGEQPVTVLAATYEAPPENDSAFQMGDGAFVDVQVTGAEETTTATVYFYYPSTITGDQETSLKLYYYDEVTAEWIQVRSSGNQLPDMDPTDNLDGTISGGRFAVIFDGTSTPMITDLKGTVFGSINSVPQVLALRGPAGPVALGTGVSCTVEFAALGDPGQVHVQFDWGDGTQTSLTSPENEGQATATHVYARTGVYQITVRITDAAGDVGEARLPEVVIYDPEGGFVTGGGWLDAAPGTFGADPTLRGRWHFSLVTRYQKGMTRPEGTTSFRSPSAGIEFQSTQHDWLVVSGNRAQYRGQGQLNGKGQYGFQVTVLDGRTPGQQASDQIRVRIWELPSGQVVFDNCPGAADVLETATLQEIQGGNIAVHPGQDSRS